MNPKRRAVLAATLGALMQNARAGERATRAIPSSGETIPVIGLGTWQTFDAGASAAARAPLREVLALLDGNMVDSSPMYGAAESVVGDLLADLGMRSRVFLATKVWTSGRAEGIRQIEQSFRRLRAERLDLVQVHNLVDVATHARTLQDMKAQGRLRYIGITHYTSSAYREVERALKIAPWDFLQINYSLSEREAEERILPLARESKVAVIINRPFGSGSMFRATRGKPLPPWAADLGIATWAQYFLKWIVSHPAVTCAIPATSKPAHMKDNLGAGQGPLPDDKQRKLMAEFFDSL
jgi:diketogulonate reductase-like aldo/keto reductase